ncbi:2-oxoacid:acceptor oxidoreductase family protein [archaeon]|nr:2-oxoacid:acceptor oxidoreductase family protein [archaeon]
MKVFNVLVCGVGGQGVVTTGIIIARAALVDGHHVKVCETRGVAKRGGSVVVHIRWGEEVASPLIPEGATDLILGLDPIETLRWLSMLAPTGVVVSESEPFSGHLPEGCAIQHVRDQIRSRGVVFFVPATAWAAREVGSPLQANVLLVGVAKSLGVLPVSTHALEKAVRATLPYAVSIRALQLGLSRGKELQEGKAD